MNRQRLTLFILAIVFLIAVVWSYSAMPRFKTVDTASVKSDTVVKQIVPAKTSLVNKDDGSVLHLSMLDKEAGGFTGYRRNIFKPLYTDEAKILKHKTAVSITTAKVPAAAPVQPQAAQPVAEQLARFTFLGFLKKGAVKTIFLAKDKEIVLVKKGDVVAGRYEATEISEQALSLVAVDSGDKIVIPLIENQHLVQPKPSQTVNPDEKQ